MKRIRRILSAALALCLMLCLAPLARADSGDDKFKDKSWDELVNELLTQYKVSSDSIALGYYNTVTGEEHYLNPDKYMVSGSMYKVPLNMVFAEKVANGEMDWDYKFGTYTLEQCLEATIIHSDNDLAKTLWSWLGNNVYHRYREIIAPYMGEDAETVDQKFYENNFFTPRQMIYCLNLLYSQQERFPRIIETMQRAEPNNYFKLREHRFNIAHKYGFLLTEWHLYLNDCGIAFTDDPILLVLFTDNVNKAYDVMTDYCTLMCDYAQYHTRERIQQEKEAALAQEIAQAQAQMQGDEAPAGTAVPAASGAVATAPSTSRDSGERSSTAALVAAGFTVLALVLALIGLGRCRRYRLRPGWDVAAALLAAVAVLLCALGSARGTLAVSTTGDPSEVVVRFFQALEQQHYEEAYACLDGCASLGLEEEPENPGARRTWEALRQSYAYTLHGDCAVDGLSARQLVELSYLSLADMEADLEAGTQEAITQLSKGRSSAQLYTEDGGYQPAFAQEAYAQAVSQLLAEPERYITTSAVQLELTYRDGRWLLVPGPSLLKALSGGLSY